MTSGSTNDCDSSEENYQKKVFKSHLTFNIHQLGHTSWGRVMGKTKIGQGGQPLTKFLMGDGIP